MNHAQATAILTAKCLEIDNGNSPSTGAGPNPKRGPRSTKQACSRAYWTVAKHNNTATSRTRAYLSAYQEICGSSEIPAVGIPLDDGYMHLDKGVMRVALNQGLADLDESRGIFLIQQNRV